jgi:hypothetical protein
MVVFIGISMISDSFGMTGFAISENGNYASGSIFGIIGMMIFIGGVLMLTTGNGKLEDEVQVYDSSNGKNKDVGRYYTMVDKHGKRTTLDEFKRMIEEFRREKGGDELVKIAREEYAALLLQRAKEGNEEKAKVARSFLEVLGIKPEEEQYKLAKEERREIINAFHEWGGSPDAKQREILKKYGMYFEKGEVHSKLRYQGTGYFVTASNSPSDVNGAKNMVHEIIKVIEKSRKESKK